jgi:hypothetical protein
MEAEGSLLLSQGITIGPYPRPDESNSYTSKPKNPFNTGDSRYTRFRYPRFRITAVLFQYYEEHQVVEGIYYCTCL